MKTNAISSVDFMKAIEDFGTYKIQSEHGVYAILKISETSWMLTLDEVFVESADCAAKIIRRYQADCDERSEDQRNKKIAAAVLRMSEISEHLDIADLIPSVRTSLCEEQKEIKEFLNSVSDRTAEKAVDKNLKAFANVLALTVDALGMLSHDMHCSQGYSENAYYEIAAEIRKIVED